MKKAKGLLSEAWEHPWGRTLVIAATVAMVSWAVRETAVITWPIFEALQGIVIPLALGFTLAYVLTPAVDALHNRGVKRRTATIILFAAMGVLNAMMLVLVLPAMIGQTVDIVQRSVDDAYYYDENGNGRYEDSELRVLKSTEQAAGIRGEGAQQQLFYFYNDANGNQQWDGHERQFSSESMASVEAPIGIVGAPSLFKRSSRFIETYQYDIAQWVHADVNTIDESALAFAHYYMQETQVLREALTYGLDVVHGETTGTVAIWNSSLTSVLAPHNAVTLKSWHRAWPHVDAAQVAHAAHALTLTVPTDVPLWTHTMQHLGLALYVRHSALLDEWRERQLHEETAVSGAQALLDQVLSVEDKQQVRQFLDTLRQQGGEAAVHFLHTVTDSQQQQSQGVLQSVLTSIDEVLTEQMNRVPEIAATFMRDVVGNVSSVMLLSLNVLLIPVYAFFLTLAMPAIRTTLKAYVPLNGHDRTLRIIHNIEKAVAAFFRGRLIVCIVCALLTWIGFLILNVPYAALFGVLIGLATAVPLAGLVFLVPAILLMIADGGDNVVLRVSCMVVWYGVIQGLEATVLTPTIMGKEVELHPVLLIVALMLCGSLLGVFGLILAVPIAATARILSREFFLPRIRRAAGVSSTMRYPVQSAQKAQSAQPAMEQAPLEKMDNLTPFDDDEKDQHKEEV